MSTLDRPSQKTAFDEKLSDKTNLHDPSLVERTLEASRGWIAIDWNELYQSRELFDTLIFRDIKIRYKQTVLGIAWAIMQPLVQMVVFTTIFGNFNGVKPEGVPYPLFVFAGLVPWTFFTNSVTSAGTSLVGQQQLLTKIYFPRIFVPASTIGAYLVDMAIGLFLFAFLLPIYRFVPSWHLIFLPFAAFLTFAAAFGLGLILASMTIMYRDLRFIIPFVMQLLMFASPIIYQPSMLPPSIRLIAAINPMSGIINTYRWCILGLPLDVPSLVISIVTTGFVLIFGLYFFRKSERFFADIL